jgi:hypothetical protein
VNAGELELLVDDLLARGAGSARRELEAFAAHNRVEI